MAATASAYYFAYDGREDATPLGRARRCPYMARESAAYFDEYRARTAYSI